jgi:hypothetical protein
MKNEMMYVELYVVRLLNGESWNTEHMNRVREKKDD